MLILGGVHGDESEGVALAWGLIDNFCKSYDFPYQTTVVPQFNMDGVLARTRQNANKVDLNRNLPTKDWRQNSPGERYYSGPHANSEPENQALCAWIEAKAPFFILSLHSWHPMLNINGDCLDIAESISQISGYKIEPSIGYPTPGCLGTYTGIEKQIPTLTYEVERGLPLNEVLRIHVPATLAGLNQLTQRKSK